MKKYILGLSVLVLVFAVGFIIYQNASATTINTSTSNIKKSSLIDNQSSGGSVKSSTALEARVTNLESKVKTLETRIAMLESSKGISMSNFISTTPSSCKTDANCGSGKACLVMLNQKGLYKSCESNIPFDDSKGGAPGVTPNKFDLNSNSNNPASPSYNPNLNGQDKIGPTPFMK